MNQTSIKKRVALLERQVSELQALLANGTPLRDWRSTVGMFSGDEVMKRIEAEGRKWRETERRKARRTQPRKQRARV